MYKFKEWKAKMSQGNQMLPSVSCIVGGMLKLKCKEVDNSVYDNMATQPQFIHYHMKCVKSKCRCIPLEVLLDLICRNNE